MKERSGKALIHFEASRKGFDSKMKAKNSWAQTRMVTEPELRTK
jgi:hypothetical protein